MPNGEAGDFRSWQGETQLAFTQCENQTRVNLLTLCFLMNKPVSQPVPFALSHGLPGGSALSPFSRVGWGPKCPSAVPVPVSHLLICVVMSVGQAFLQTLWKGLQVFLKEKIGVKHQLLGSPVCTGLRVRVIVVVMMRLETVGAAPQKLRSTGEIQVIIVFVMGTSA